MLLQMLIIPFIGLAWVCLIYFLYYVLCEMIDLKKKVACANYKDGIYKGMSTVNSIAYSVLMDFDRKQGGELYEEILRKSNEKRRFL